MQSMKKNLAIQLIAIFFVLFSETCLFAAWSPAVQISSGPSSVNPAGTALVIDSNSVALVGWLDGPIGVAQTLSSATLFPTDNFWSAPQLIFENTGPGFPVFPFMSFDIFGNQMSFFAVLNSISQITASVTTRPTGATTWPAPISQVQNAFPAGGTATSDGLGNISGILALTTTGTPPFDIILLQFLEGSSAWLPQIVLAQDNSTFPVVAIKADKGNVILAWKSSTPILQLQTERFNTFTQQLSTIINVPLPALATDIFFIDLALDSLGDAIIVYIVNVGGVATLYTSTLFSGSSTWSNPILLSNPANNALGVSISTDDVGNATILWGEAITPTQQFIRVASLPLGGTPTLVRDLTDRNATNSIVDPSSRVVMDSFGNAVAIWGIVISGTPYIQVSSKAIGQNWSPVITLSNHGRTPLIALSDQGTAVATWIDSVTGVLMGSRNLFLFSLAPPIHVTGRIITDEFLTETAYFLKIKWQQSLAPNIIKYKLLKRGKVVAVIPNDGIFTFLQPLHSKHIKTGDFTLIAIASNGNRSAPIPVVIKKK